jgi:hypothetical protein
MKQKTAHRNRNNSSGNRLTVRTDGSFSIRINALGRSIVIGSQMEGGEHAGKN